MCFGLDNILSPLPDFLTDESGATAIEYSLIASIASIAILGALTTIGTTTESFFIDYIAATLGGEAE